MSTTARITYDEFDAMIRRGEFASTDDRFELLLGEICVMPLPDPPHEDVVDELNEWGIRSLPVGAVRVRIQSSLGIPALDSLTQPDVAWMRKRGYSKLRPIPEDVLLLIEVSDSTLSRDRNKKGRLRASAGIGDYWIINLPRRQIEVRRDPLGNKYTSLKTYRPGQEVRPLAFPEIALPVSLIFAE